jgi:SAM-dependent methyltransferase
MDYFDDEDNVRSYERMETGPGGALLVGVLKAQLPRGRRVLELGMGPGKDLDLLLAAGYLATGSDRAALFLRRYEERGGTGECLLLDAVTVATEERFDAIYSNKVLHHLDAEQLATSLRRQAERVAPGGLLLHSFWRGNKTETHHGMLFTYWERAGLEALLPSCLKVKEAQSYAEMWEDDSIWVLFEVVPPTMGA